MTEHISTEEAERIAEYEELRRHSRAARVIRSLAAERDAMREAILWADGERGEFPPREEGDPPYWWRKELRRRAALGENQP